MLKLISQSRSYTRHGTLFEGLAAPSSGSRENAVWMVTLPPGSAGSAHAVTREEIFVALEGEAEVRYEGKCLPLRAGSALVVPAGVYFAFANTSDTPFKAVAVLPVGGQAQLADGSLFDPPWAQ